MKLAILAAFLFVPMLAAAGQADISVVSNVFLAPENPQPMYFPVTRGGDSAYDIVFGFHTSDGSALAGLHYGAAAGIATLPANQQGAFLPVVTYPPDDV